MCARAQWYCQRVGRGYDPAIMRVLGVALLVALVARTAAANQVEVTVDGMQLDPETGSPVVRLAEKGKGGSSGRTLPIWIGPFEAQAIALEMQGVPPPRPLTHDLMKQLVERLGGKLKQVEITDLRDNTYFATLHIEAPGGKDLAVDARPSDAIALALRLHGPILVSDDLFAKAAAAATSGAAHLWGLTLQDLTPEMASFFHASHARGVLVSDVQADAPAHDLVRGDIITALDDRPVGSVEELTSQVGSRAGCGPVNLSVRRAGRPLHVRFSTD
jgi:uncharacterized protein